MIYVPEAKSGQHSRRTKESIEIRRWVMSTDGMLLEYVTPAGELQYHRPPVG